MELYCLTWMMEDSIIHTRQCWFERFNRGATVWLHALCKRAINWYEATSSRKQIQSNEMSILENDKQSRRKWSLNKWEIQSNDLSVWLTASAIVTFASHYIIYSSTSSLKLNLSTGSCKYNTRLWANNNKKKKKKSMIFFFVCRHMMMSELRADGIWLTWQSCSSL